MEHNTHIRVCIDSFIPYILYMYMYGYTCSRVELFRLGTHAFHIYKEAINFQDFNYFGKHKSYTHEQRRRNTEKSNTHTQRTKAYGVFGVIIFI